MCLQEMGLHSNLLPFCWKYLSLKVEGFCEPLQSQDRKCPFSLGSFQVLTDVISDVWDVFRYIHHELTFARSIGLHSAKCQGFNGGF